MAFVLMTIGDRIPVPGPQEAEPETSTVTLKLSPRQARRLGELADLLATISDRSLDSPAAAGTLLLGLVDGQKWGGRSS